MLTPLKTLEDKLAHLLDYVEQLRLDNAQLHSENTALHRENQTLLERMAQAQQHVDHILHNLESQNAGQS